jgi:uncharacterized protein (TIGR02231 family)
VLLFAVVFGQFAPAQTAPPNDSRPASEPSTAPNKITSVTVYQGNALITRSVDVPAGTGLTELIVRSLPPQTIDTSLFTEGTDGLRVLTTRLRTRAVMDDTRAEVRAKQDQINQLNNKNQEIQKQQEVIAQNLALLSKLEAFTAATMQQLTEKGVLSAENTIKLAGYVMDQRQADSKQQVALQQQLTANQQQIEFLQRQLSELTSGASHTEREAVIVLDKSNAAPGQVHLNYLVNQAGWQPQYKLRAGAEKDPVQVEYLAAIQQQTGEDWSDVQLVLSTAQPMLNAAPPELLALSITVGLPGQPAIAVNGPLGGSKTESYKAARDLRQQAQQELAKNNSTSAFGYLNSAAASQQWAELLAREETSADAAEANPREGPSVAYHLPARLTVPSRNDSQLVEVARIELAPTYFYKAVPVLSPHVYRLSRLANKSNYVLLPGEATVYVNSDFVGRMTLPLVAIGEEFTAGFGVDPQIQVTRELASKNHSVQGGNQVQTYDYRIRVISYKPGPVQLQVWDRLPKAETEAVAVELAEPTPSLSIDPDYQRTDRPKNLLRWDLSVNPTANNTTTPTITYQFRLQYDRNVAIGNFQPAKR